LGAVYEKLGNLDKAEECHLKSVNNGVSFLGYQNYAMVLYKKGKLMELRQFLETRALLAFPDNPILKAIHSDIVMLH